MPATPRSSFRLSEADLALLDKIRGRWGGEVKPLDRTSTIREMIFREAERLWPPKTREPKKKKS